MEERLIREEEAARILGVSAKALQRYRLQEIGPKYIKDKSRPKSPVRYRMSDILEYINNNTVQTIDGKRKIEPPMERPKHVEPKGKPWVNTKTVQSSEYSEADKLIWTVNSKCLKLPSPDLGAARRSKMIEMLLPYKYK